MAMLEDEEALIICNGYKDEEYIETALLASKLGRNVILVVEKLSELPLIAEVAKRTGVRPRIGMRVKLSPRGRAAGRRRAATARSSASPSRELVEAIDFLRENDLLDCFELLHFHLGSQISAIRNVKNALREAGRFYVELAKLGAPLKYLDVGGGLGVDYDGSQTNFASSMNYTMQEYANDIVFARAWSSATPTSVPHPTIVSESGRAVVAHHAVLVVDVLGVSEFDVGKAARASCPTTPPPWCATCSTTYREVIAQERARGLPRRARVQGRVPARCSPSATCRWSERVRRRGHLLGASARRSCSIARELRRGARGARGARAARSPTPTSATSRCSSRCPTRGPSTSSSRSCRSTGWTRSRRAARCWPTSPATPTARSTTSSTGAT